MASIKYCFLTHSAFHQFSSFFFLFLNFPSYRVLNLFSFQFFFSFQLLFLSFICLYLFFSSLFHISNHQSHLILPPRLDHLHRSIHYYYISQSLSSLIYVHINNFISSSSPTQLRLYIHRLVFISSSHVFNYS